MGYIYKITNLVNGKIYIGKTSNTIEQRFNEHLRDSQRDNTSSRLYNAIRKYGKDNFIITVVEEVFDDSELDAKEIYWIQEFHSQDKDVGYNITSGGTGGDILTHLSEEALIKCKEKMSKARKGMHLSEEVKKKLSEANKGKYYHSEETKKAIADKLRGRKQPEEEKEKRRASILAYYEKHPEVVKARGESISQAKKGKVHISIEQREQISQTLKEYFKTHKPAITGKHFSEEIKQHLSEVHAGRIHINNGTSCKVVIPDELDSYLAAGWVKGRLCSTNNKIIICINDNLEFNTLKETAKYYGISEYKLRKHLKNNTPINGKQFKFKDSSGE